MQHLEYRPRPLVLGGQQARQRAETETCFPTLDAMRIIPEDGHDQAARYCGIPSSQEPHDARERNPPKVADWDVVPVGPGCVSHNRHDAHRDGNVGVAPRRLPCLSPQSLERTEILPIVICEMRI